MISSPETNPAAERLEDIWVQALLAAYTEQNYLAHTKENRFYPTIFYFLSRNPEILREVETIDGHHAPISYHPKALAWARSQVTNGAPCAFLILRVLKLTQRSLIIKAAGSNKTTEFVVDGPIFKAIKRHPKKTELLALVEIGRRPNGRVGAVGALLLPVSFRGLHLPCYSALMSEALGIAAEVFLECCAKDHIKLVPEWLEDHWRSPVGLRLQASESGASGFLEPCGRQAVTLVDPMGTPRHLSSIEEIKLGLIDLREALLEAREDGGGVPPKTAAQNASAMSVDGITSPTGASTPSA